MSKTLTRSYLQALALGAVAGLRSMTAPALLSLISSREPDHPLEGTSFAALTRPATVNTLGALALGELIADKLPQTPARTAPPALIVRALSGAFVGAACCGERKRLFGALIGAGGAIAATFGAYHLRQAIDRKTGLPDPVVALVEDAIAIGSGLGALRI